MGMHTYIGARYVPRFLGTYDGTQAYEALDVVDNGLGTSYIAKIPTDPGTPLTDNTHWSLYGSSSGAVIDLQNQIDQIKGAFVTPEMFGAVGDGVTDDTTALQNATNAAAVILTGSYSITQWIDVKHDMIGINANIIYHGDGVNNDTSGFLIDDKENITIKGINFDGSWNGTGLKDGTDEYSHAIRLGGGNNIIIENCSIKDTKGDGIYIYADANNVKLLNIDIDNAYRNCISMIKCHNVTVENCYLHKNGDYVSTLDIEPNQGYADVVHDVIFRNCKFFGSGIRTINMYPDTNNPNNSIYNITFDHCDIECTSNSNFAIEVSASGKCGDLTFNECNIAAKVGVPFRLNVGHGTFILRDCKITGENSPLSVSGFYGGDIYIFENNDVTVKGTFTANTPTGYIYMNDNKFNIDNYTPGYDSYAYNGGLDVKFARAYIERNYVYSRKGAARLGISGAEILIMKNNVLESDPTLPNKIGLIVDSDNDVNMLILEIENTYKNQNINTSIAATYNLSPATYTKEKLQIHTNIYCDGIPSSDAKLQALTYKVGDICYNSEPATGEPIGWVCTVAGTPGTWKAFGTIA